MLEGAGGDVAACVADVGAVETALTPSLLQSYEDRIRAAPLVVLDGNLSSAALQVIFPCPQI